LSGNTKLAWFKSKIDFVAFSGDLDWKSPAEGFNPEEG
jgi:hypothetical protein